MPADLAPGTVLGQRYRVVRLLGHGGMGSVYEATQIDLGRRVAVKVLDPRLSWDGQYIERFKREAHAAAMLGHPNIVQVTDFQWPQGEVPFLVMERLEGQSLAQRIETGGALDARSMISVAVQTLDALAAAHGAGIIHRDIKPDNLFLVQVPSVGEIVKVLDFGIAKLADAQSSAVTATGAMLGTPAYMSPEQARGSAIDARVDIYALGACMYHALTGQLPFTASSAPALLFAIVEQTPRSVRDTRPDLPGGLVAIVERAMAKDPAQRFASAAEMRGALAELGGVSSVVVTPPQHAPTNAFAPTVGTPVSLAPPVPPVPNVALTPPVVQPTFPGVANPTPVVHPPPPSAGATIVKWIVLGLIALTLIGGAITLGILYMVRPIMPVEVATTTPPPTTTAPEESTPPPVEEHDDEEEQHDAAPAPSAERHPNPPPLPTSTARAEPFVTTAAPHDAGKPPGVPIALNPALPPATTGTTPYSGAWVGPGGTSGWHCEGCDGVAYYRAVREDHVKKSLDRCFAESRWEPPVHEDRGYVVEFDATGTVTQVLRQPAYPSVPRLDACIAKVLMSVKVPSKPPKKPTGGHGGVTFSAECTPGWHGHCVSDAGAATP